MKFGTHRPLFYTSLREIGFGDQVGLETVPDSRSAQRKLSARILETSSTGTWEKSTVLDSNMFASAV
jgi:hypothetical protein